MQFIFFFFCIFFFFRFLESFNIFDESIKSIKTFFHQPNRSRVQLAKRFRSVKYCVTISAITRVYRVYDGNRYKRKKDTSHLYMTFLKCNYLFRTYFILYFKTLTFVRLRYFHQRIYEVGLFFLIITSIAVRYNDTSSI